MTFMRLKLVGLMTYLIKTPRSELSAPLKLLYSATHRKGHIPRNWKHTHYIQKKATGIKLKTTDQCP